MRESVPLGPFWRYHFLMATNLRLSDREAQALRAAAQKSGKSQQSVMRAALTQYLGLDNISSAEQAIAEGLVRAPSTFVNAEPFLTLDPGQTTLDLLERDER